VALKVDDGLNRAAKSVAIRGLKAEAEEAHNRAFTCKTEYQINRYTLVL
jgi:hypothetical protein